MSEKILVPELGESITEATVSKWLKSAGDRVEADEPIVELETDKVNLEVPSPVNGVLGKINASEGDVVEVGSTLGHINSGSNIQTSDISKNEEVKKKENNVIKIDVEKKTETKEIKILSEEEDKDEFEHSEEQDSPSIDDDTLVLTNEVEEKTEVEHNLSPAVRKIVSEKKN